MEKEVLASAGAMAGFIAAILTIIDRLFTLRDRAAAAARSAAAARAEEDEAGTLDSRPKPARVRRRRWWAFDWPAWLGPAPAYLIQSELALICGGGILLNSLGLLLSLRLESILFLDMVGTAFAAFLLGPWWGAATALLTNALVNWLLYPHEDPHLLIFPWTLVNMAGGFYWGALARTSWFRTYLRSGHASVLSHVTFLVAFGMIGACAMAVPGALVQSVVSHATPLTLNPTIVAGLQLLFEDLQRFAADQFGIRPGDAAVGIGAFLPAWLHACLLYIPDKVVSVAMAMTLVKRGFPIFEQELVTGAPAGEPPSDNRLAPLLFGLLYAPVFALLISNEVYLADRYWPLWSAPWILVVGGYLWLSRSAPPDGDLRAARGDRAARYREEWRPLQRHPRALFCQRLTVGWLMASALFALFMPVMLDSYSSVAFNFFALVYGSMLGIHLMRVSVFQNMIVQQREVSDEPSESTSRRRRSQAA